MIPDFANDVQFCRLLAGEQEVDLVAALLEIAADAYHGLDRAGCYAELDRLGTLAAQRVTSANDGSLRSRLLAISRVLYSEEGFRGNAAEYYDPRNSYLNEVLHRKLGIPISLAMVYMAVAQRAGVTMHGVGTPGHFMVAAASDDMTWFVDPFTAGSVMDRETCRRRVETILGQSDCVDEQHFQPATGREIVLRTLRNLKAAYVMDSRWLEALPVEQRLAALLPDAHQERRDLGLMYLRTGQPHLAIKLLLGYARQCSPEEVRELAPFIQSAERMLAELN